MAPKSDSHLKQLHTVMVAFRNGVIHRSTAVLGNQRGVSACLQKCPHHLRVAEVGRNHQGSAAGVVRAVDAFWIPTHQVEQHLEMPLHAGPN